MKHALRLKFYIMKGTLSSFPELPVKIFENFKSQKSKISIHQKFLLVIKRALYIVKNKTLKNIK